MTMRFRIASIFIAAALVLSCGVLAAGHVSLYAQREAVTLEETTLLGDVSAVEGVQVEIHTQLINQLFWDTQYTAGTQPVIHTDYTHYWSEQPNYREWDRDVLRADFCGSMGVTSPEWEEVDQFGMQKPFNDVASRCPAGTENYTERVRLRDYYEYFPIYVSTVDILPDGGSYYLDGSESVEMMMQDFLRSQFRFPVPEDLWVEFTVGKDASGAVTMLGTGSVDDYNWESLGISTVRTEAGLFFTLSPDMRADGTTPDFSHCTVERGLYFLPITLTPYEGEDFSDTENLLTVSLDMEHFQTVCPIDADADRVSLYQSNDGNWLYLLSQQRGEATLTVLSADTGEITSQVTLFTLEDRETQALSRTYLQEGYLIATRSDGAFALVTVDGAGQAEISLAGDFSPAQALECYMDTPVFDYDGERLAFADLAQQFNGCSFFLGVVSAQGMEYLGKYLHNQDLDGIRFNSCSPVENDPLAVRLPEDE